MLFKLNSTTLFNKLIVELSSKSLYFRHGYHHLCHTASSLVTVIDLIFFHLEPHPSHGVLGFWGVSPVSINRFSLSRDT